MGPYLVRRVLALLPVMAVVVTVVFLLIHLIPGDPVSVMLGPDATTTQIEKTRQALGGGTVPPPAAHRRRRRRGGRGRRAAPA